MSLSIEQQVAQNLLAIKAVFLSPNEPFTWASGIKSPIYCDNRLTMSFPKVRRLIAKGLAEKIKKQFPEVEVIAGTATAGIPHAAWVAEILDLPMVYIRSKAKDHGKGNQIEGQITPGQKMVVIEDLISTGMVYSSNFKSGEKIVLKSSDYENEIKVVYPNGDIENLKAGEEVNSSKYLGVYKLNQNETKESFAVNFPSKSESNTSVQTIGENENIITSKGQLKSGINLGPLFILLAMIVVAIEWILYKKGN